MRIGGTHYRSIWYDDPSGSVQIIDQTLLPHRVEIVNLRTVQDAARAISTMQVRGAPLIGAAAAYGLALALLEDARIEAEASAADMLRATRPTAVNLGWALERVRRVLVSAAPEARAQLAMHEAAKICDEDARTCEAIGTVGLKILEEIWAQKRGDPVQILTHCNAGWLATVDWGTALAPVFKAHAAGIPVHVWVSETRPRNQGASLTAFELVEEGIPHTLIVDNVGGHLMQHGQVDLCLVGSDRTTSRGEVCNKVGTYLKALAAHDNGVPFYVALPVSTVDWSLTDGKEISIEERDPCEVLEARGQLPGGELGSVRLAPAQTPAINYGFDVTPARLVTGLITEHGTFAASPEDLHQLRLKADAAAQPSQGGVEARHEESIQSA